MEIETSQLKNKNRLIPIVIAGVLAALCLVSLGLAIAAFVASQNPVHTSLELSKGQQYTLYVGMESSEVKLNDPEKTIKTDVLKYTTGYTMYEAQGGWKDDAGNQTEEPSMVVILEDIEDEAVVNILNDLLADLHQTSILVSVSGSQYTFYRH